MADTELDVRQLRKPDKQHLINKCGSPIGANSTTSRPEFGAIV
jgi:hypothetical protein